MMATGHQVVGFTFGVGALVLLPEVELFPDRPFQTVLYLVFVLFGALLPDIDTPRSKLGQKFWRLMMLVFSLALLVFLFAPEFFNTYREELKVYVLLMLPILIMIKSHRKMTHSFLFIGLLVFYSFLIEKFFQVPFYLFSGIILGAISHLCGDFVTRKGIPLFYPLTKRFFRFPVTFRTGSLVEKAIVSILILGNVWYLMTIVFKM
ncbi:metal-dependent hydrolase [Halobacillus rhizosphaerae]|uniref:metal-dependent hydrolase n=1 Tax=Halobacillus rhizosphaerae TaxID=3064889 RepID=UPI00398A8C9C